MDCSSDWAKLPKELLKFVLERLPTPVDYVHFSLACTSWKSAAKESISQHSRLTNHPLLLAYTGKEETWRLCDMSKDKVLDVQLELPNQRFCGFSNGWLITMDENFVVILMNPLSKVKGRERKENSVIKLPAMNIPSKEDGEVTPRWSKQSDDLYLYKATMSADPISNAKDCVVLVVYKHDRRMAFIRLHKDTIWTYVDAGFYNVHDMVYFKDKCYALDDLNHVWSFPVTTKEFKGGDVELVVGAVVQHDFIRKYLVQLSEPKELLMVKRYMSFERDRRRQIGRRKTDRFEVFRIDADNRKWIEIKTIGDVAIFVGDSAMLLSAPESFGCQPNCIYFLHDWDCQRLDYGSRGPRNFGVYNLGTQKFEKICTAAANLMRMSNQMPIWTTANIEL